MAFALYVVIALAAFCCVWLLLGLACGPGAVRQAARERLRLRLLGWMRRLSLTRAARALADIDVLAEVGASLAGRSTEAGFTMDTPAGCVAVLALALAVVAVSGIVALSWSGVLVGIVTVCAFIVMRGTSLRRARRQALEHEMPRVFRSLAGSLAAGRTLPQALACLGKDADLSSKAYGRAALAMACGYSASDALAQLAEELDTPGGELLVSALLVSHRTGSPLMGLFQRAALIVERDGELERLLSVKTAQVRLSVRVVCVLPAVIVGLLALISSDFRAGLATPSGRVCLLLAVALDLVAIAIVRRLLAGVM